MSAERHFSTSRVSVFKAKMKSTARKVLVIAAATLLANRAVVHAATPPAEPFIPDVADRMYFVQHSLELPHSFRALHPGPDWILQHAADFHMTSEQTARMTALTTDMWNDVVAGNSKLRAAYAQYETDASGETPSESKLKSDLQVVGEAQTHLAGAMIPYHLQAYDVLDAAQRLTFARLVKAGYAKPRQAMTPGAEPTSPR